MKLSPLLLLFPLVPSAGASVLVVDPANGPFTEIQAAVDASVDGDVVLVGSGTYSAVTVTARKLVITADAGASVLVQGGVRVASLAPSQTFVLANVDATGGAMPYGLRVEACDGHVRIEGGTFRGAPGQGHGISSAGNADLALTRVRAIGGSAAAAPFSNPTSGHGLEDSLSSLTLYDSVFEGGDGGDGAFGTAMGASGGHGVSASDGALFASGSAFLGGDGGDAGDTGVCFNCSYAGAGGAGIRLSGAATAEMLDTFEAGGAGGHAHPTACCSAGELPGPARLGSGFTDLAGTSRHLVAESPVREGTTATLTLTGEPGELVRLLISRTADRKASPLHSGVLLLGSPIRLVQLGTVPPGGVLTAQVPVFTLGPGLEAITLHLQSRFTSPQGVTVLSGPAPWVVLDQGF